MRQFINRISVGYTIQILVQWALYIYICKYIHIYMYIYNIYVYIQTIEGWSVNIVDHTNDAFLHTWCSKLHHNYAYYTYSLRCGCWLRRILSPHGRLIAVKLLKHDHWLQVKDVTRSMLGIARYSRCAFYVLLRVDVFHLLDKSP